MDSNERLTRLEMILDELRREREADRKLLSEAVHELTIVRTELTRYKGFIGGVLFIVSALATLIELFGKKIGLS